MTRPYSQLSEQVDSKQSLARYQVRLTRLHMQGVDLERLRAAMIDAGMDQSALARAAGCTPGAINQIIQGNVRRSKFLPDIADALGVSLRWLKGQPVTRASTDPAPPRPLPQPARVLLEVNLPSEDALARMFEGLLGLIEADVEKANKRGEKFSRAAQARQLAQLLPTGLSQLRDLLPVGVTGEDTKRPPALPTVAPAQQP